MISPTLTDVCHITIGEQKPPPNKRHQLSYFDKRPPPLADDVIYVQPLKIVKEILNIKEHPNRITV